MFSLFHKKNLVKRQNKRIDIAEKQANNATDCLLISDSVYCMRNHSINYIQDVLNAIRYYEGGAITVHIQGNACRLTVGKDGNINIERY